MLCVCRPRYRTDRSQRTARCEPGWLRALSAETGQGFRPGPFYQEKDTVTPRDERDQSVERWLERRSSGSAAPTGACLDAETAAAWVDGGLSAAATAQAEMHVAECARC